MANETHLPMMRSDRWRASHKASVVAILGKDAPPVYSMGSRFYNIDRWTVRALTKQMCDWAKKNPETMPLRSDVEVWVKEANATVIPPHARRIVIASTPENLSLRVALALAGGGYHEALHTWASARRSLMLDEVADIILPRWAKVADWSKLYGLLQEWSNLVEDIRIERRGTEVFPGIFPKMCELQDFILAQEEVDRIKTLAEQGPEPLKKPLPILFGMFRDIGLGYETNDQERAFRGYHERNPDACAMVENGPLTSIVEEAINLTRADDTGCLRLSMDALVEMSKLVDPEDMKKCSDQAAGCGGKPKCPKCGAPGKDLVVRPLSDGNGGKVKGKGVITCTKCGWQEIVDLNTSTAAPSSAPTDPDDAIRFEDVPQAPGSGKGKGEKGKEQDSDGTPEEKGPEKDGGGGKEKGESGPKEKDKSGSGGDAPEPGEGPDPKEGKGSGGVGKDDPKDGSGGKEDPKDGSGGKDPKDEGKDGTRGKGDPKNESGGKESGEGALKDEGAGGDTGKSDNDSGGSAGTPTSGGKDSDGIPAGGAGGHKWDPERAKAWEMIAGEMLTAAAAGDAVGLRDLSSALEEAIKGARKREDTDCSPVERPWRPWDLGLDVVTHVLPSKDGLAGDKVRANRLLSSVKTECSYLRARLRAIVRSVEQRAIIHGVRRGRGISERMLTNTVAHLRAGQKPPRAYYSISDKIDTSIAAVVILDQSGSMGMPKTKLQDGTKCLMAITEPLDSLGGKVMVAGFRDGPRSPDIDFAEVASSGCHRVQGVCHDIFKDFDEKFVNVRWRFANTRDVGGTPMADGVQFGLDNLSHRQEAHRVLFIVTDGQPNAGHAPIIRRQARLAKKAGIHLIGVGIGNDSKPVIALFPDHVWAATIAELPKELVKKLNELLDFRGFGRGTPLRETA